LREDEERERATTVRKWATRIKERDSGKKEDIGCTMKAVSWELV